MLPHRVCHQGQEVDVALVCTYMLAQQISLKAKVVSLLDSVPVCLEMTFAFFCNPGRARIKKTSPC